MKFFIAALTTISSLVGMDIASTIHAQQSSSLAGEVQRVWEDGFHLDTGNRVIKVDSWDVYGDATGQYISTGDRLTVTGEFENGEFDAFSIINDSTSSTSTPPTNAQRSSMAMTDQMGIPYSGTVKRVWEDGFRLNTGDRILRVDSWDVCRDFTARHVSVGDRLTITGEFEGREFDAFSITNSDGNAVCQ